jgi:hypothetical protein
MTSLTYASNNVIGNVFEAMMEKGQDQIPDDGFLMTKDKNAYVPGYFIVTVDKILLCLGVLLL